MDDDLFPDLAGFTRPSTTFDFPLDPSLIQPVASTSRAAGGLGGDSEDEGEWDDGDESLSDLDDDSDEDDDDETDAEDEYRAAEMGVVKPPRVDKGKGKAKAPEMGGLETEDNGEELGRLIHAIRDSASTTVGGRTALDKEFDRSIEEELDELDNFGSKKGKGGKKTMGRRPVTEMEPSAEVKALLGMANRHYAMGEHEEALKHLTEVVRIDPTIRGPWYTLATIHEERGDKEKAVMFKIVANHLSSAKSAAVEWAELGSQSRDIGLLQQAIYCFSQAIKGNKNDVDSMWDRAVLLKMSGSTKQATTAFTALLNIHPHDPGVLRELAPLLASQELHATASSLYLAAFDFFRTSVPHVDPTSAASAEAISSFHYQDLEALADLLTVQKQYAKVVSVIKQGVRWLQGREHEAGWDALGDDREFDQARKERTGWEKVSRVWEDAPVHELDVRLRVRLAVARMAEGRVEEAQRHFGIVLQEDVAEFPELYGVVADAYFDAKMYSEALEVYQDMAENDETNGPAVWIKVGQCNYELGDLEQAKECYEAVAEEEPDNLVSKMQLARVYEQMGEPDRALATINEIIGARRRLESPSAQMNLPEENGPNSARRARQALSKEERGRRDADRLVIEEQRVQEFSLAFNKLDRLYPAVHGGDENAKNEWLKLATHLVDAFRETRQLFPSDAKKKFTGVLSRRWRRKGVTENDVETQANEMASRLERTMEQTDGEPELEVDSYRGKDFDGWLTLIVKYAFVLAKNDEVEAGQETLLHVQEASIFRHSPQRTLTIRLARMALYIYAGQPKAAVVVLRWVWLRYQFQTQPLRLLHTLLSRGLGAVDACNQSNLQKFFIRQLKQVDGVVEGKGAVGDEKDEDAGDGDEEDEENTGENVFKPTVSNPIYLLAYGHLLLVARSFQSSIIYMLRAYELAPNQPLITFSLGVAYLSRAMVRQTDNRQHQIAQALGFFSQYRKLKGPCQEVEYNFGRLFHQLGLQSYAVKHYEAVLRIASAERLASQAERMNLDDAEDDAVDPDDFAKVAAYNLSMLYISSGSEDLGRAVARRWLAV